MSEFNILKQFGIDQVMSIDQQNEIEQKLKEDLVNSTIDKVSAEEDPKISVADVSRDPFDVNIFIKELEEMSETKNQKKAERLNQNITGYDIAHNCIRETVYKIRNTPVPSYADKWLPIYLRSTLGTAVHEFIQGNSKQFTELEVALKIPSIGFYGKIDGLIGNNVLCEIKSCSYADYTTLCRQQKPRTKDYLQAMCYKYILENYTEEARNPEIEVMGSKPALKKYNIDKIQFIYVAHDIITADLESIGEILENIKHTKKLLESKNNPFFFISSLVIDCEEEHCKECNEWIKGKIDAINWYVKSGNFPKDDEKYLNKSNCYFCMYKNICDISK